MSIACAAAQVDSRRPPPPRPRSRSMIAPHARDDPDERIGRRGRAARAPAAPSTQRPSARVTRRGPRRRGSDEPARPSASARPAARASSETVVPRADRGGGARRSTARSSDWSAMESGGVAHVPTVAPPIGGNTSGLTHKRHSATMWDCASRFIAVGWAARLACSLLDGATRACCWRQASSARAPSVARRLRSRPSLGMPSPRGRAAERSRAALDPRRAVIRPSPIRAGCGWLIRFAATAARRCESGRPRRPPFLCAFFPLPRPAGQTLRSSTSSTGSARGSGVRRAKGRQLRVRT